MEIIINLSPQNMTDNKPSLFKRAFSADQSITKQEIADILFVLKQVVSILLGIAIGYSGLLGMAALVAYGAGITIVCHLYVMKVLQPEEDTIETGEIAKEHFMIGFFNFLLSWIITYNLLTY